MKTNATLLALACLLLTLAPFRTSHGQNQYERQVLQQLQSAAFAFTSAGYAPVIADGSHLAQGETMTYTVTLQTGASYMLMGVCDQDCRDLDLALYDGYGNLVSADETEDAAPVVDVTVATGGDFTLEVTMYRCSEDICFYGVGVYGQ